MFTLAWFVFQTVAGGKSATEKLQNMIYENMFSKMISIMKPKSDSKTPFGF